MGNSAPHIQVCGTTGAGKGVALSVLCAQFLQRGEAVFFFDPKNDEWAPSVLYGMAKKLGVPYHYIDLNRPNGAQFNIFEGASVHEAFELFQAGLNLTDKGGEGDFYNVGDRREANICARLMGEKKWTFAECFEAQKEQYKEAEKFYGRLQELAETPSINAKAGGISFKNIIAGGGIVYVVGSGTDDIIKTAQRISLVRIIQLAKQRDRMAGELRKIGVILDECKHYLSKIALMMLAEARDKGVHVVLAHQTRGDLRDVIGVDPDACVDGVVENCKIKLFYRVMTPDTAEWAARMSGTILVDDESRTVEKNLALSEVVAKNRNIRQADRYFIDENMLLNLPKSVAVLYGCGLPKFVSIQPILMPKDPAAIAIREVAGAVVQTASQALDVPALPEDKKPSAASLLDVPPLDDTPFAFPTRKPAEPPMQAADAPLDADDESALPLD